MIRRKLKSFTIIEVIVTLILTVLVFSISFLAYRIIQSQLNRYADSSNQQMEYLSFIKAINGDVTRSLYLVSTTDGFECWSQDQAIRYIIQDSLVIRENSHALQDSFSFKQLQTQRFFEGAEILERGEPMDEVSISFLFEGLDYYVNASKDYDARTKMELNKLTNARD